MAQTTGLSQPISSSPISKSASDSRASWLVVAWGLVASTLLIASGIVRAVQTSQFEREHNTLVECPFPLTEIPRTLDGWHVVPGSETVLDPLTTRITGSTDHSIRTYVNEMTGVTLSVLVLYGPAEPVLPHTPQVCYPSSGFRSVGETTDHDIKLKNGEIVSFRASVFAKSGGRVLIQQAVYHSYLLGDRWSPDIANRELLRENPGIFKIQIQRRVVEGEARDQDEPIESFIQKIVPVLEQMTSKRRTPPNQPAILSSAR